MLKPSQQQCDINSGLIVGGVKAHMKEFPHLAAIGYRRPDGDVTFACGGSIISQK